MKKGVVLLLAALLIFSGSCAFAQENRYTHPTHGYSFTMPDDWLAVDSKNIENHIAAYEKGVLLFPGTDAASLKNMLSQVLQLDCTILLDPHANNAIFVTENTGVPQTSEQVISQLIPLLKARFQQRYPDITFTACGDILTLGENDFIALSGTYSKDGMTFFLDQLYLVDGTQLHCISLTISSRSSQTEADRFYSEIINVLASCSLAAQASP